MKIHISLEFEAASFEPSHHSLHANRYSVETEYHTMPQDIMISTTLVVLLLGGSTAKVSRRMVLVLK